MYQYKILICVTLGIIVSSYSMLANEYPRVSNASVQWMSPMGDPYSPYSSKGYYFRVDVTVSVPTNIVGDYFMGFVGDNGDGQRQLTQGREALTYYLTSQKNVQAFMVDWPNIVSRSQTKQLYFDGSNRPVYKIPIYVYVEPGQVVSPGIYTDVISIKLYKGSYAETAVPQDIDRAELTVSVEVSDQLSLTIGQAMVHESMYHLSFDELVDGESTVIDVQVQSNVDYVLVIRSTNKGTLAHAEPGVRTRVPYAMRIDQNAIQWNDFGEARIEVPLREGRDSVVHQVKVTVGQVRHAFKGQYQDELSFSAVPSND